MRNKTYQQKGNASLLIINQKSSKKVLVNHVVLLKADENYTTFFMENGHKKVVAHSIKFFESFLATHGFLRVHRSFMVNPDYIQHYNQEQATLTMTNGQTAFISRRRRFSIRGLLVA
jgi:DNA-binding LytR/AlgR family response regulator